jgi:hypothetical protein
MGEFIGTPAVELLEDGRLIKLLNDFSFKDNTETLWSAPKNAIVDGASIPRALWAITGGPLEGKYRNASILHDWFCDVRSRDWRAVHRMFHEAMLVSGVDNIKARIMYLAVYYGGPRWSDQAIANANLDPSIAGANDATYRSYASAKDMRAGVRHPAANGLQSQKPEALVKDVDLDEFKLLAALVEHGDVGPDGIEAIVDQRTTHVIR